MGYYRGWWLYDLTTAAGHFLRKAVADLSYDGGTLQGMRAAGIFFERREPSKRLWRMGLHRWTLTSDQLLEMIIGLGALQPAHCGMLALFLGIVPHTSQWDCYEVLRHALAGSGVDRQRADGPEVGPWEQFLNALRLAAVLDVTLLIDC